MGESDKPRFRYSTSEMARDAVELLDQLGWANQRELNVVGVSMGGMIAQELGLLIPDRIASLSLISTAARIVNTVGFVENLRNRANLFIPRSVDSQLSTIRPQLFSASFLAAPDADATTTTSEDGTPTTTGFPTNADRFSAQELAKRRSENFTRAGFILQAIAAGWHAKTEEQLKELGDRVGRDRILIMHGTEDRMITVAHAEVLAKGLGWTDDAPAAAAAAESEAPSGGGGGGDGQARPKKVIFQGRGHVLLMEERQEFLRLVEEVVEKGARQQ
ncbi:MAG: hypothetical protein M1837_003862 [Sclerophora amabilis]|nr:MAG: hypothetical protein M1837_003862 [Sclerophora amabilis]